MFFTIFSFVAWRVLGYDILNILQLRKVAERVRPRNGPMVDERDSLLEQIRTKVRFDLFIYLFIFFASSPSLSSFFSPNAII